MPLQPGTRIGSYQIVGALGAGGMGEVYRARDNKLSRDVAIKVLPDAVATDSRRLARFTREAQTLAALNHPNIATIYGVEDRAIVMELVEGDDLSERITGGLSVNDALMIARQVIDAVEAAHDSGIVHRDLKPGNIRVREDGTVKVLDFGIAKSIDGRGDVPADESSSPTVTVDATSLGQILGTAPYMSPEQVLGRTVDKRSDVWAFGCVLYEMLTGTKAFKGDSAAEIMAAIVKSEPAALPSTVPAHVRAIVDRCLVKERKHRIPDLSVVRYLLDDARVPVTTGASRARLWQAAAAVLAIAAIGAGVAWYRASATAPAVTRFEFSPPPGLTFTAGTWLNAAAPAISPDGRTIAFTAQDTGGRRQIWLRSIDSLAAQPLAGTDGAAYLFWSPDSRFIGYSVPEKLMKIPATGGTPVTVCALNPGITGRGGSWNDDGVIVFNNGLLPLYRVSSSGGDPAMLGTLRDAEAGRQFPTFLPDGRHFLYHANGPGDINGIYVASLDENEGRLVTAASSGGVFDAASGNVLFVRQGRLLAQKFDLRSLAVTGEPFIVAEQVPFQGVPGLITFSLSKGGVLTYGIGEGAGAEFQMTWVDRTGKVTGTSGPPAHYRGVDVSADGSRIAAHRHERDGGDIWLTDVTQQTTTRFTFDAAMENAAPAWSPDGTRMAFASVRNGQHGISVKATDNTGKEERLFETSTGRSVTPFGWSADGTSVLFGMIEPATALDLWRVPMRGDRRAVALVQSAAAETQGQLSPDGKWLAYASNETGLYEVYVQSMAAGGGKWAVSTGGGIIPRWRGDSGELFYYGRGKMVSVPVKAAGAAFATGAPIALFDYVVGTIAFGHPAHFSYAVSKDGQRFLLSLPVGGDAARSPIVVAINWLEGIPR